MPLILGQAPRKVSGRAPVTLGGSNYPVREDTGCRMPDKNRLLCTAAALSLSGIRYLVSGIDHKPAWTFAAIY